MAKYLYFRTLKFLTERYSEKSINRILMILITISGTFLAFSAGANNSANAVGPLVGLVLIGSYKGL